MADSVLSRLEIQVLRNVGTGTPSDVQVPAAGAVAVFYRQGATVKSNQVDIGPGEEDALIEVYSTGWIARGDIVLAGLGGLPLLVTDVDAYGNELLVSNPSEDTQVSVFNGTRLVVDSNRPKVFADPAGSLEKPPPVSAGPDGRVGVYTATPRFDYTVLGGGLTDTRFYVDQIGGVAPSPPWRSARDFPTLQAAIDSLPATGGEVHLPAGIYTLTSGLVIQTGNVTLRGDGPLATIIQRDPSAGVFDLISVIQPDCRFYDLQVDGAASSPSVSDLGSCMRFIGYEISGNLVQNCYMENLRPCPASC